MHCPVCGHAARKTRHSRARWTCLYCGWHSTLRARALDAAEHMVAALQGVSNDELARALASGWPALSELHRVLNG